MNEIIEKKLLINFSESEDSDLPDNVWNILNGKYEEVLSDQSIISETIIKMMCNSNSLEEIVHISGTDMHLSWLCTGVASLLYFVQNNWTGPYIENDIDWLRSQRHNALKKLSLHDECNTNVQKPELLYLSKIIFSDVNLQLKHKSCIWWLLRVNLLHQHILEEDSGIIFEETQNLISQINSLDILEDSLCKVLFNLEAARFYMSFRRIQESEIYLEQALNIAGLTLTLQGAMGKRTKYQQEEKAQLYLKVTISKEIFPSIDSEDIPASVSVELSDELRLEKTQFSEQIEEVQLGAIEEAIILTKYTQMRLCQPKHKLTEEEIRPYLTRIINNTKNWSLKMTSLHYRCTLEREYYRTAARSLRQGEHLEQEYTNGKAPVSRRIDLFFASGMKPIWMLKEEVAYQLFQLDMPKAALEVYTQLSLWEEVIACYRRLDLNHKASEIILQELAKKPTVKLWCLLGDTTGDVSHYETAWKLSDEKSSRAQRHWGYYYFTKKNVSRKILLEFNPLRSKNKLDSPEHFCRIMSVYVEAIPHLKLSVELNSIQEMVWFRLGYAALQVEDWNLAATAYRRYCSLEPSSFEAWNNLGKAYIKMGNLARARKSLDDAIRCNYDRWEIWDNYMAVNGALGYFSEVIRSYHRILDLKPKHLDDQILRLLANAVIDDVNDANGNPTSRLVNKSVELFERVSAEIKNPDIWRMYAQLIALQKTDTSDEKSGRCLITAYNAVTSDGHWFENQEKTLYLLELCCDITQLFLHYTANSTVKKKERLGTVKLLLQKAVVQVQRQNWTHSNILESLTKVEEFLQTIKNEIDKIKSA